MSDSGFRGGNRIPSKDARKSTVERNQVSLCPIGMEKPAVAEEVGTSFPVPTRGFAIKDVEAYLFLRFLLES